jgi:thioredoxin-like negative regulator of GroEL
LALFNGEIIHDGRGAATVGESSCRAMNLPLLDSLRRAVSNAPDDVPLRLHLAVLLDALGLRSEAVSEASAVLARDPDNDHALEILLRP